MDLSRRKEKIKNTLAVFITHAQGLMSTKNLFLLKKKKYI